LKISLITPAGPGTRNGNRHTALRWAAFLRAAGHTVTVEVEWSGKPADLMLALHARRSHGSIVRFPKEQPLVVALTGTDVYRDIHTSREAKESLQLADRFIVLQPKAIGELPGKYRRRARVVVQSSSTTLRHRPVGHTFRICVIGHLRDEKDPLRALAALRHTDMPVEVIHLGAALDERLGRQARDGMKREARYRWLGNVPHGRALRWLASSHAMVISSRMEGGANVVCEALRIGVPVLASRISGNIGLLGPAYPAYFTAGSEKALAELIERTASQGFYRRLKRAIAPLRAKVSPQSEARALLRAIG
jgi:putative glycosyltransferase (TIGR04348 family)